MNDDREARRVALLQQLLDAGEYVERLREKRFIQKAQLYVTSQGISCFVQIDAYGVEGSLSQNIVWFPELGKADGENPIIRQLKEQVASNIKHAREYVDDIVKREGWV